MDEIFQGKDRRSCWAELVVKLDVLLAGHTPLSILRDLAIILHPRHERSLEQLSLLIPVPSREGYPALLEADNRGCARRQTSPSPPKKRKRHHAPLPRLSASEKKRLCVVDL